MSNSDSEALLYSSYIYMQNAKPPLLCMFSAVAAPQLMSVVLSFRNGTFELSLQYDQQVWGSVHVVHVDCYLSDQLVKS